MDQSYKDMPLWTFDQVENGPQFHRIWADEVGIGDIQRHMIK